MTFDFIFSSPELAAWLLPTQLIKLALKWIIHIEIKNLSLFIHPYVVAPRYDFRSFMKDQKICLTEKPRYYKRKWMGPMSCSLKNKNKKV